MPIKKIKIIKNDSIIDIQLSGAFYTRLQQLLLTLSGQKTNEEFLKTLNRLKEEKPITDVYDYNIETLMLLVYEVESKAEKQGKVHEEEIDTDKIVKE